jgi:MFS family permease
VEDFVDGNANEAADFRAHENPHYNIRDDIDSLTPENFGYLAGDFFTVLYAFMVLFTGSASDIFNRKKLLLWTCFGWCVCTYLSSFVQDFTQLMILRVLVGFFNAVSGPCSYSLITDWFPPESRTLAYSIYAFGAQFGGPVSTLNTELIAWLGWRAAFQFLALSGFVILGISILCFDEPERGRFDINHSVINNPEDSIANNTMAY